MRLTENTATLSARTNPFSGTPSLLPVPTGPNLPDLIDQSGLTFRGPIDVRLAVNGLVIPREKWETTYPQPHDLIELCVIPRGGGEGGKNPLRIIMSLALLVAAPFIGPAVGGFIGSQMGLGLLTTTGASLFTGLTFAAGMLAVNALCPPPSPGQITARSGQNSARSDSYSITGSRNRLEPYAPVPLNLGRNRVFPPYAAKPYTELSGQDQFLRCLFLIGYAPNLVGYLRIGETPIEDFEGVEFYIHEDFNPATGALKLWSQTVDEDAFNIELKEADGWTQRTTEAGADEISLDFTLPQGLVAFDSQGGKNPLELAYEIQYSPAGENNWSIGSDGRAFPERPQSVPPFTGGGTRYYRVVMHRDDGSLELLEGTAPIHSGGIIVSINCPSTPPQVPDHAMPVCLIARTSGDLTGAQITDERTAELKRNGSADFLPHAGSPATNSVIIDAGTFYHYGYLKEAASDVIRINHRFRAAGDPSGQYDVRARRLTPDRTGETQFDSLFWTALRGITHETPIRTPFNVTVIELRIRATNQLQGIIDQFNCIVSSQVKDWDKGTGAWVLRESNLPASLYRHVLQGPAHKKTVADAKIDLTALQAWHENSLKGYIYGSVSVYGAHNAGDQAIELEASTGSLARFYTGAKIKFENDAQAYALTADSALIDGDNNRTINITPGLQAAQTGGEAVTLLTPSMAFNQYVDYQASIDDILKLIAASARAAPTFRDGKYSVIEDKIKAVPVQHFSPRNSWGFSGQRLFPDLPHAWRVRFKNEDRDFRDDEAIVYNDGYNRDGTGGKTAAALFEALELPGSTDYQNIVKLARYHIRTLVLRPEIFQFQADVENIVCTRGSLVRFSHDVPSIGLTSGRVKAVQVDGEGRAGGVTLDEICPMEAGKAYSIRFRKTDGSTLLSAVATDPGAPKTITFSEAVPVAAKPAVGDLGFFGETGKETLEVLVKSILPGEDLTACLTVVPYAPEVLNVDEEEIPDYEPLISVIPGAAAPVIDKVRSDEWVMVRDSDGSLKPRILVTFAFAANRDLHKISHIAGQYRISPAPTADYKAGENNWIDLPAIPKDAREVSIYEVEQGQNYDVRFRYVYVR